MWVRCTSLMFGPDMMSLRPISELMKHFEAARPAGAGVRAESGSSAEDGAAPGTRFGSDAAAVNLVPLVALLQRKQSSLAWPFCRCVGLPCWG